MAIEFTWLPTRSDWADALRDLSSHSGDPGAWQQLIALANCRIDFVQTGKLDRLAQKLYPSMSPPGVPSLKLALLGSSTLKHLVPGIRVAGLRRKLWLDVYEGHYGMYHQEIVDSTSDLHRFKPNFVVLALDAHHVAESDSVDIAQTIENLRLCWRIAKKTFGATVIQQTALPVFPPLLGSNEHRLFDSPHSRIKRFNFEVEKAADQEGVHLLSVADYALFSGLNEWYDAALWHRSKQEVHPCVSHIYGDLLVRLVAADRGLSYKCLVLDLDNTLWGGVIGDDGLQGIQLGQGNALGEAFVAFQKHALALKRRGVILAVCSKNEHKNALEAFEQHPEMVLRRSDIACFMANWDDKAANLRKIASTLNIGIDSLVFVDDNPFERNLVRQELPQIAVPEISEDPAFYIRAIADAGYFEGVAITNEDRERSGHYQANAEREVLRESSTDMASYLAGLNMELICHPFDDLGLNRVTQLINKTNQFNLTTRRYTEAEVRATMLDPDSVTLQARLIDRFGDNGIIAILIAQVQKGVGFIDTWLMSCRVLGRGVEEACLNFLAEECKMLGAKQLQGEYRVTAKNGIVRDLYSRLGFELLSIDTEGNTIWVLPLDSFVERPVPMKILKGTHATN